MRPLTSKYSLSSGFAEKSSTNGCRDHHQGQRVPMTELIAPASCASEPERTVTCLDISETSRFSTTRWLVRGDRASAIFDATLASIDINSFTALIADSCTFCGSTYAVGKDDAAAGLQGAMVKVLTRCKDHILYRWYAARIEARQCKRRKIHVSLLILIV